MAAEQEVLIPTGEFLEQFWKQLPQSEANGNIGSSVKKFMVSVPNLVICGVRTVNYVNAREAIENLLKIINSTTGETKECLEKALNYQKECGVMEKVWQRVSGCPSATEMLEKIKCSKTNLIKMQADYLDGIKKVEEKFANSLLISCSISSAIICLVETVKLINIWDCINEATNCIVGGEDRQKIVANLATLRIKIDELATFQSKFGENEITFFEKRDIMEEIDNRMPEIQQLIFATRLLIGKVQISINGKQEQLSAHLKDLKVSVIGTGAQLALNMFQFGFALSAAGALMTTVCTAALTVHTAVLGAQLYTKKVTGKTIENCRKAYVELDLLDQDVQKMQLQYNEIRLWVKKIMRRLKEQEDAQRRNRMLIIIIGIALLAIYYNFIL